MALIGAVEDAAAGGARTEIVERLLARRDHIRVEGHAHIVVGAEQDGFLALDDGERGRLHLIHDDGEGIAHAGGEQRFTLRDKGVEFAEEIGHCLVPDGDWVEERAGAAFRRR